MDKALAEWIGWVPAEVLAAYPPGPDEDVTRPARVDVRIQIRYRRSMANAAELRPGETLCPRTPGTGAEAVGPYPDILGVPIVGAGLRAFRLRGLPSVGEIGALHVSGRELIRWRDGELHVTPPWMGGRLQEEYSSLMSSIWVPGLEVGPTETASFTDGAHTLGDPDGPGTLTSQPTLGSWHFTGSSVRAGGDLALAVNLQVIAALNAFNAAIQGGVNFTPPQKGEIAAAVAAAVAPLLGTQILTGG